MSNLASVAQDMIDSDESFRSQFDRTNDNYHNGLTKEVPLGGKNIPVLMKDHSDWENLPIVETKTLLPSEYGSIYENLHNQRETAGKMKKTLTLLSPHLAAINDSYKTLNEAIYTSTKLELINKEKMLQYNILIEQAKIFNPVTYKDDFNNMLDLANKLCNINTAEVFEDNYQLWMDVSKKVSTKLFSDQNKLLQEMKAEKKRYLAENNNKNDAETTDVKADN